MNIETWAEIRRLRTTEQLSISAIARRLQLCRITVRKALRLEHFHQHRKGYRRRASKLDPFKPHIEAILAEFPDLSSVRILEKLRSSGYRGGISIVRQHVARLRLQQRPVFVRVQVQPGERFEVDWAHCGDWSVPGGKRPLSCFVMVSSFSRQLFLEFVLSRKMEMFLACHQHAFTFFGGLHRQGLYDNLKSVVLARHGSTLRFQPEFLDFAGYHGFQPVVCNPRAGWEKGRVESTIKFIRANFLAGRTFTNLHDLNLQACHWRDQVANLRLHATTRKTPADLFEQEKSLLHPLPPEPYGAFLTLSVLAYPDATVLFDTNRYSVPLAWAHRTLILKADPHQLRLLADQQVVAEHPRCWGCHQEILYPDHHRGLQRKKQAAATSLARAEFLRLGPEADDYLKGLVGDGTQPDRHIRDILALVRLYGATEVRQALTTALHFRAYGSAYIRNIIIQQRRRRRQSSSPPIHLTRHAHLLELDGQEVNLAAYDAPAPEERNS